MHNSVTNQEEHLPLFLVLNLSLSQMIQAGLLFPQFLQTIESHLLGISKQTGTGSQEEEYLIVPPGLVLQIGRKVKSLRQILQKELGEF